MVKGEVMVNEHPSYANPTITEAICEIHFRLSQSREVKRSLPGEIFKLFQDEDRLSDRKLFP